MLHNWKYEPRIIKLPSLIRAVCKLFLARVSNHNLFSNVSLVAIGIGILYVVTWLKSPAYRISHIFSYMDYHLHGSSMTWWCAYFTLYFRCVEKQEGIIPFRSYYSYFLMCLCSCLSFMVWILSEQNSYGSRIPRML